MKCEQSEGRCSSRADSVVQRIVRRANRSRVARRTRLGTKFTKFDTPRDAAAVWCCTRGTRPRTDQRHRAIASRGGGAMRHARTRPDMLRRCPCPV
jgi:hypothetical protein